MIERNRERKEREREKEKEKERESVCMREREKEVSTRSARGGRRPRQQRKGNNGYSSRPDRVIVTV